MFYPAQIIFLFWVGSTKIDAIDARNNCPRRGAPHTAPPCSTARGSGSEQVYLKGDRNEKNYARASDPGFNDGWGIRRNAGRILQGGHDRISGREVDGRRFL